MTGVILFTFWFIPWKDDLVRQMRCLGLLISASILWVFQTIPLHTTAMAIPIFASLMGIMSGEGSLEQGANVLIKGTISNTPYMAIGGFAIAMAMSHTKLDEKIASLLLYFRFARRPVVFLALATILEYVLTMFISNVSSTTLVISIVLPVLRESEVKGDYAKLLLLAVSMSGNVAGMASPLASPQSLVGLQMAQDPDLVDPPSRASFGSWTLVAFPVTFLLTVVCFFCLFFFYKVNIKEVPYNPVPWTKPTVSQYFVGVVSIGTIALWFAQPYAPLLGNGAIVAMIPFVLFFSFNFVDEDALSHLPWKMLFLLFGGGSLGEAIRSSELLGLISKFFGDSFSNLHVYVQLLILTAIVGVISIFVSHTVAAVVLLPLIASILGANNSHMEMVLVACSLIISPPMLLAVASFPNIFVGMIEDADKNPHLNNMDFLRYGGTVTILGYVFVNSIFYFTAVWMKW